MGCVGMGMGRLVLWISGGVGAPALCLENTIPPASPLCQPSLGCSAQLNCNPGGERSNRSLLRVRGCCPKICPDCSVLVLGWWSSPSFSDVRMEEELLSVGVREG